MTLNDYARICHEANAKWWLDLKRPILVDLEGKRTIVDYEHLDRNVGELLMLCVSELAEAMEGHRKNLQDDKLPHRKSFEVELADCLIRIFDLSGALQLDLEGAFTEKMQYNAAREDHKIERRLQEGGKKY